MGIARDAVAALKGIVLPTGQGRRSVFWGSTGAPVFFGRTGLPDERDYEQLVGDGSHSSLIAATIGWIADQFPEPRPVLTTEGPAGIPQIVPGTPAAELLRRPTWDPKARRSWYSGAVLSMGMVTSYWIDGNAYALKRRDPGGRVIQLWYCPHWMLEPIGSKTGGYIDHYDYFPTGGGTPVPLAPSEIWHVRQGIDPNNPLKGWSRLKTVLREVYTDEQAARFAASMMKNRGMPGVILAPAKDSKMPVKKEDRDALKAQYIQEFGGDNVGGVKFFGQPTELQEFGFSPEQLQLGDLRNVPEERVTSITHVPGEVVGFGSGSQSAKLAGTIRERREQAWENNIIPTLRIFAEEYDGQVLPDFLPDADLMRFSLAFDLRNVGALQDLELKKAEIAARLVSSGLAWRNEGRARVGYPPVPGGDTFAPQPGVQGDGTPAPAVTEPEEDEA